MRIIKFIRGAAVGSTAYLAGESAGLGPELAQRVVDAKLAVFVDEPEPAPAEPQKAPQPPQPQRGKRE